MGLESVLADGGIAVVIGGRSSNFPDPWRQEPRVQYWDSSDPDTRRRRLPTNARAVLLTRFLGHELFSSIQKQVKKNPRCVLFPGLQGTGQVKERLTSLLGREPGAPPPGETHPGVIARAATAEPEAPAAEAAAPVAKSSTPTAKRGELKRVIETEGNLDAAIPAIEGRRLHAIARERGITTTEASCIQGIYTARSFRKRTGAAIAPVEAPPPPELVAAIAPDTSPAAMIDRLGAALRTFEDAIAGLVLMRDFIRESAEALTRNAELEARSGALERRIARMRALLADEGGQS